MKQIKQALNQEQLQRYDRDGFLILRDWFDSQSVARFSDAAEELKQRVGPVVRENPRIQCDQLGNELGIRMVWPVIDISATFGELARDPRIIEPSTALFGDSPVLFEDKLNYKYPQGGSAFPVHQDFVYWQSYSPRLTSVLVYLDEATEENGCLQVIPGGHKKGLLPSRPEAVGLNTDHSIAAEALDLSTAVKATGGAGTVLIFSCFTPHFSGPNLSRHSRRAMILTYSPAADGSFYEAEGSSGPARDRARQWLAEQPEIGAHGRSSER